jgi:hypothetical protein
MVVTSRLEKKVFWYLDKINQRRSCHWSAESLEWDVREFAALVEELYGEWLRATGLQKGNDGSEWQYLVLPYISFRLLNGSRAKEVDIFTISSAQRKRFLQVLAEDLHELPDNPLVHAMMKESLRTLHVFLQSLKLRRQQ